MPRQQGLKPIGDSVKKIIERIRKEREERRKKGKPIRTQPKLPGMKKGGMSKSKENAELKKQLEVAHRRIAHQVEQVDQASDSIMGVIGHKVEALAESVASRETERALDDFDIHQYECEIGDMLDERLPEGLDDESRSEDLKAAVSELLANATIKIELE